LPPESAPDARHWACQDGPYAGRPADERNVMTCARPPRRLRKG
jgi:hypothetical protein